MLKRKWRAAAERWRLEDSRGFEFHRAELKAYRLQCEAEERKRQTETMVDHAPDELPRGAMQVAGEVTVLSPTHGRVTHRHALVVGYDSAEELCAAVQQQRTQFLMFGQDK